MVDAGSLGYCRGSNACGAILRGESLFLFVFMLHMVPKTPKLISSVGFKHYTPWYFIFLLTVKYLPYMYGIYYWMLSIVGFWVHVGVAFGLGYAYYYLKIYAMSHYGKDYFPTPGLF